MSNPWILAKNVWQSVDSVKIHTTEFGKSMHGKENNSMYTVCGMPVPVVSRTEGSKTDFDTHIDHW